MSASIFVLVKELNPRIRYTFAVIFKNLLGFDQVHLSLSHEAFDEYMGIKLSYSKTAHEKLPYLLSSSELLYSKGIDSTIPDDFTDSFSYPCFFVHNDRQALLPFDFPALVFWLISRYEEYQPFVSDRHGRFPATESFAFKNQFLELPVINLWALELKKMLRERYPNEIFPKRATFKFIPSYDIDYAWAYKHKALWRQFAAALRDIFKGNFTEFHERMSVLSGKQDDPYFTFAFIKSLHESNAVQPIFFWLVGNYGEFDKNTDYRNKAFRALIKGICSKYKFGIHPSYASNENQKLLKKEISRLSVISDTEITLSRQHFLKLNFPETYRKLVLEGIAHDYTMGYAELAGFRASVALPFPWYDILNETETGLIVHPFMLMDVMLNGYMKLNVDEALNKMNQIEAQTKAVGGELVCIWHNSSFSEKANWVGWRKLYSRFIENAQK